MDDGASRDVTIYTWGYNGQHFRTLQRLATERHALVIDTRFAPWSRDQTWNMPSLKALLQTDYRWIKDFGNRNYQIDSMEAIQIVDLDRGARTLAGLVTPNRPPLLLCMCPIGTQCHRSVVATYLHERFGWAVEHLPQHADRPAPPSLF